MQKPKEPKPKAARHQYNKAWYEKNKAHVQEYSRAYWKKNKAVRLLKNKEWCLKNRNGIEPAEYAKWQHEQQGVCALCGETPTEKNGKGKLVVDHNHSTGKARALLCSHCNSGLGYFNESIDKFYRAVGYIRKHNKIEFQPGDPIEIVAIDHTSDDTEGWKDLQDSMKSTPALIHTRGYYLGEDEHTVKIAFAKCDDNYSTVFNIAKGTILDMR